MTIAGFENGLPKAGMKAKRKDPDLVMKYEASVLQGCAQMQPKKAS